MTARNILLTGIPRSGTTLTCYLLNKLPNTVALHEPMDVGAFRRFGNPDAISEEIDRFIIKTRESLLDNGTAISKHVDQKIPDNHIGTKLSNEGLRESLASLGPVPVQKPLNSDFMLGIKHPSAFSALLAQLEKRFSCYAVIRNPLSVLASWNSIKLAVQSGHAPVAESLDGELRNALDSIPDVMGRQLYLLSWFYGQYRSYLPNNHIIRYEDIIGSRGRCLAVIASEASELDERLESRNSNPAYDSSRMRLIADELLKNDGEFWNYYTRESVERLLTQTLAH